MKKAFGYKRESKQNPYIGFTTFNHFEGEALYSDCIVGVQGIAGCETEPYECYPVPEGVEEKGREQGFPPMGMWLTFVRFGRNLNPSKGNITTRSSKRVSARRKQRVKR